MKRYPYSGWALSVVAVCAATRIGVGQEVPSGYPSTGAPPPMLGAPPSGLPGPPVQPEAVSRPADWPGGEAFGPPQDPYASTAPIGAVPYDPNKSQLIAGAQVLANINSEVILYSEVAGFVNDVLITNADKIPPEQVEKQREMLTAMRMRQLIETKLLFADAKRTIRGKNEEGWNKLVEDVGKEFEGRELKRQMKRAKAGSRAELDAMLHKMGTSVDREKRSFVERAIASQWLQQQTESNEAELPPQELWKYYSDHVADYSYPAEVRWEHLMTKVSRYEESKSRNRLAMMGNRVVREGIPLSEVAKRESEGPDASSGGQHDWTKLDDLGTGVTHVSAELRHALETLPVGGLSQIIEDSQGYHIVRVLERKPAGRTPFDEVQAEIKLKLQQDIGNKKMDEYLAKLQKHATVRTVFDGTPLMQQLVEQEQRQKLR